MARLNFALWIVCSKKRIVTGQFPLSFTLALLLNQMVPPAAIGVPLKFDAMNLSVVTVTF